MAECQLGTHKFIRSGHGNDMVCRKCGYAAKQALMPISVEIRADMTSPFLREKFTVPMHNGSEVVRVERYKDDVLKEFRDSLINTGVNGKALSR